MLTRVAFLVVSLLLGLATVSHAAEAPAMTVSLTINGQSANPTIFSQKIGVNTPVVAAFTLENVPDGTVWQSCWIPSHFPIAVDQINPEAQRIGPVTYIVAPATRAVTVTFHATAIQRDGPPYTHVSCSATLPDGRSLYAVARWRLGLLPANDVYLPIGANTGELPPAYPAPTS